MSSKIVLNLIFYMNKSINLGCNKLDNWWTESAKDTYRVFSHLEFVGNDKRLLIKESRDRDGKRPNLASFYLFIYL